MDPGSEVNRPPGSLSFIEGRSAAHPFLLRYPFEELLSRCQRFSLFANAGFLVVLSLFDL